ncbi:UNVERIFIED_CONTAM: hypothetical protein Slati_4113100 [Sesamum latifolium]|uniref:BHLH domain-containing protein n=1 Tax=Sesamum latifolium TaxID=2727402 RepID=A0AAW2T8E4_9LAMI
MDSSFFLQLQQDDELSIGDTKFSITYPGSTIWDVGSGTEIYFGDHVRNLDKMPKESEGGFADQDLQKKITHREIERQRRQEMSTLYASLRSVLPPDYLKTCSVGVEVQISGDVLAEGLILPLSRIQQLMLEEGLVVVCCNWTNFDGRLCYVIQSEVVDYRGIDLQKLQSKLTRMINTLIAMKQ